MDFLLGVVVSSLLTVFVFYASKKINAYYPSIRVTASQSRTHFMYPPIILPRKELPPTQSIKHSAKNMTRIIFTAQKAYWIQDNALYQADIENGLVVEDSTKVVDTMSMDKVQLDEMMFIVQKLTEGNNIDNSGSGN